MLEVDRVSKSFIDGSGTQLVLQDFSLAVAPKEVVAIRGPSGSGKSTLLNLIAGLMIVDSGEIKVCIHTHWHSYGTDAKVARLLRRNYFGVVFQFANLVPTLTLAENVRLPLELTGRLDLAAAAFARVEALGLSHRLDAFPEVLSGGERQRAAVARALAHEPQLVLADEPTGNLDDDHGQVVANLLCQMTTEAGASLLIATHDEAIANRADRIVQLSSRATPRI